MFKNHQYRIVIIFLTVLLSYPTEAAEIWVSKSGSDLNPGTKEEPLASVHMALRKARELRRLGELSDAEGIDILITGGIYYFNRPLRVRPEDAGTIESPTTIMAAPGAEPIFSGGLKIEKWQKFRGGIPGLPDEAKGKLWVADIPINGGQQIEFRQMWVNNKKALRASSLPDGELDRILAADSENEEMWIPTPDVKFNDLDELEFVIHQWWAIANLRVKSIERFGEKTKITFHQPESTIEFEHPWPAPFIDEKNEYNGNSAFFFQGAIELLNQPGEWHLDEDKGKVYYWPRDGENMKKAEIIIPFLETIAFVEGTLENPVSYFNFRNIRFEHTTWMRPSKRGHVPLQAGFYIIEAYKLHQPGTPDKSSLENQAWTGRQPAGIIVKNASRITFERCVFQHMAATGLDLVSGVDYSNIIGNVFRDIGGTGIQVGFFGGPDFEAHLPYNPADKRELVHHIDIKNNLITNATNEDWGTVGIGVGFAHDINIAHNEIRDVNYSGISVGWGWTETISASKNNRVHANEIHRFAKQMYDVGGIYTLSAQPNMVISENAIYDLMEAPYAHIPDHYQYIYFDEGSSYIRAIDNWTEKDKFFSNSPGPGNVWENNGPEVSEGIRAKAGIQPEYQDILEK